MALERKRVRPPFPGLQRAAVGVAMFAMALTGCRDGTTTPNDSPSGSESGPGPVGVPPTGPVGTAPSGMVVSSPLDLAQLPGGGAGSIAFVSVAPGTAPRGRTAAVRNLSSGEAAVLTAMQNGGFDPLHVSARADDRIEVAVTDSAGQVSNWSLPVRQRTAGRVVRVSPGPNRTDVPLNAVIEVVFSAPVTLESARSGVRISTAGAVVAGTWSFVPPDQLSLRFAAAAALASDADFEIEVTVSVLGVNGVPLAEGQRVQFHTTSATAPAMPAAIRFERRGGFPASGGPWDVEVGDSFDLAAQPLALDGTPLSVPVTFAGDAPAVAGVEPLPATQGDAWSLARVTGLQAGTVRVTAQAAGLTRAQEVRVVPDLNAPAAGIRIERRGGRAYGDPWELQVGETFLLSAQLTAADGTPLPETVVIQSLAPGTATADIPESEERTGWNSVRIVGRQAGTVDMQLQAGGVTRVQQLRVLPPAVTGQLRVVVATTGSKLDPDGYALRLSGPGIPDTVLGSVAANGTLQYSYAGPEIEASVVLSEVAYNCRTNWSTPILLTTPLPEVRFDIACADFPTLAFAQVEQIVVVNEQGARAVLAPGVGPEWSPDGGRVVFNGSYTAGAIDLRMVNADGSGLTVLTSRNVYSILPRWSPDGTRLAYAELGPADAWPNYRIFTMLPDGSGRRELAGGADPAWSPDGTLIAYTAPDSTTWIIGSDGSNPRRLALGYAPAWSPDGRTLAVVNDVGLWIIDADGANARLLATGSVGRPVWSPDGREIAYTESGTECNIGIRAVVAAGGAPRYVVPPVPYAGQFSPTWSPDGRWLAYAFSGDMFCDRVYNEGSVRIVASDGSGVVAFETAGSEPAWRPMR